MDDPNDGRGRENSLKLAVGRLAVELKSNDRELKALAKNSRDFFPVPTQRAIAKELQIRASIDEACRGWVQNFSWFEMREPELLCLILERILQAHSLADYLNQNEFQVPDKTQEELLTWLLVDYWRDAGYRFWQRGFCVVSDRVLPLWNVS